MSAYLEFQDVQFQNATALVKALNDVGFVNVEVGEAISLVGYQGRQRDQTAQIVVRRQYIGAASNDLGFAWNGQAFVPIISEFDAGHRLNQEWLRKLQEVYAKHCVLQFFKESNARPLRSGQTEAGFVIEIEMEVAT